MLFSHDVYLEIGLELAGKTSRVDPARLQVFFLPVFSPSLRELKAIRLNNCTAVELLSDQRDFITMNR